MDIKALREQKAEFINSMRALVDTAKTEERSFSEEETASYEDFKNKAEEITAKIGAIEDMDTKTNEIQDVVVKQVEAKPVKDAITAYNSYLKGDMSKLEVQNFLTLSGTDGGDSIVTPVELNNQLINKVTDSVFMRQIATVFPALTSAVSLGIPYMDTDVEDIAFTTEILAGGVDTALELGRRDLTPNALAKVVKVSKTLLRRGTVSASEIVINSLARKMSTAMENAYLNGDGSSKPLGVFTASASGIPTTQDIDVATDDTLTYDDLIATTMNIKGQYRKNASWIMNRDTIEAVRKITDDYGQYIWKDGSVGDNGMNPATILGYPVYESEYAPSLATALASEGYIACFGDFSFYGIVDALTLSIEVATELYAGENANGYFARLETDGAPIIAEAFTRLNMTNAS